MGSGCQKSQKIQPVRYQRSMFSFQKIIGKGGFGRVWKISEKKTKNLYAMKVIDKARVITKRSVNSIMNERQLLAQIQQHNNNYVVNIRCSFQDRQNLYLMMDYLECGDLRYYINQNYKLTENQIKFIVRCIMKGLDFLHQNNIIHRDIKPENIIFDKKGYCRITDLGIARYWKMQNSTETSGTPGYMAPEVLLKQNHSFCVDYYAVGIIAYQLVMGKRPYHSRQRAKIRDQMLARQVKIPFKYGGLTKEGIDFINKMLHRTTRKRLGYLGISQIWDHPWLKLTIEQNKLLDTKKALSPIKPLQIICLSGIQQITEPDESWRQNILLLKKPETQRLFQNYQFYPEEINTINLRNQNHNKTDLTMPTLNYITTKQ